MSSRTSQSIVVIVGLGLFGYTGIRYLLGSLHGSVYKQLWAIGALTILLTLLADTVPQLAGPLALLIALAYVSAGKGVTDLIARVGQTH